MVSTSIMNNLPVPDPIVFFTHEIFMNFAKSTIALTLSTALITSLNVQANNNEDIEVITVSSDFRQQNLLKTSLYNFFQPP